MPDKPAAAPRLDDLKFAANLCSSNENLTSGMCPTMGLWEQVVDGSDHAMPPESVVYLVPEKHLPVLDAPMRAHPCAQVTKPWQPCDPTLAQKCGVVASCSVLSTHLRHSVCSRGATQTISLQRILGNAGPTCLSGNNRGNKGTTSTPIHVGPWCCWHCRGHRPT